MKTPAIVLDFRRSPIIYFKKKEYAEKAKQQATKHGIKTRLSKTSLPPYRWKLTKIG